LSDILSSIGRGLVVLEYSPEKPNLDVADMIVKNCPILQILEINEDEGFEAEEECWTAIENRLKGGLKKLAKLKVNRKSIKLGTDWEGYDRVLS
jgi:hypothetical protein